METFELIILLVFGSILFLAFIYVGKISLELLFMRISLNNHPVLKALVDDVLDNICKEEGIKMFHKAYDELNAGVEDEKKKALGMYVYTLNMEHQISIRRTYLEVVDLEKKYNKTYKEICEEAGIETTATAEDFYLPRILLCPDALLKFGANNYYGTYFHELGHHFAVKEIGKHTEEDANKYGRKIILERLPFFFQLFPEFSFEFREGIDFELSMKETLRAYWGYLKYYLKNRKTIIKKRKK
jgi:hypothetical protein